MNSKQIISLSLSVALALPSVSVHADEISRSTFQGLQCSLDSKTLLQVQSSLQEALKELEAVEQGRGANVSAATAVTIAWGAMAVFGIGRGTANVAVPAGLAATSAALGAYNFKIDSKKAAEYKELVKTLHATIEQSQKHEENLSCAMTAGETQSDRIQNAMLSLEDVKLQLSSILVSLDAALKGNSTPGADAAMIGAAITGAGLLMAMNSKVIPLSNGLMVSSLGVLIGGSGMLYSAGYNTIFKSEVGALVNKMKLQIQVIESKQQDLKQALEIQRKYNL